VRSYCLIVKRFLGLGERREYFQVMAPSDAVRAAHLLAHNRRARGWSLWEVCEVDMHNGKPARRVPVNLVLAGLGTTVVLAQAPSARRAMQLSRHPLATARLRLKEQEYRYHAQADPGC